MKRVRIMIAHVILIFFGIIVGLTCLELSIPFLPISYTTNFYRWDERTGLVTYIPGRSGVYRTECFKSAITINSQGWRTREFEKKKKAGTYRILVLGDSFTAGLEVPLEKTFPYLLQEKLTGAGKTRFEVVSLGKGNAGLYEAYRYLKDFGMLYSPDLVLLVSFANDPFDDVRDRNGLAGEILFTEKNDGTIIDDYGLERNPLLLRVKEFLQQSIAFKIIYEKMHFKKNTVDKLSNEITTQQLDDMREFQKKILRQIKQITDRSNIGLLVVNAPHAELIQMTPNPINTLIRKLNHAALLKHVTDNLSIPFFDIIPDFREYIKKTSARIDFPCDMHWNERGHRLMSEILYTKIHSDLDTPTFNR